jgi:hypothetical protein
LKVSQSAKNVKMNGIETKQGKEANGVSLFFDRQFQEKNR